MENKLNPTLKAKVLEIRVTKLEASLLKEIRGVEYGELTFTIFKKDGQPYRIVKKSSEESKILNASDGLNLEGAVYVRS